jgi:glycosyltransferase involved in cell wall biosynthesis
VPAPRVHVLYEYGIDGRPHASSALRLLRPLWHPLAAGLLDVSAGIDLPDRALDAVIVDRLWRPDVDLLRAERLVGAVRKKGALLLYALDDNLLDLRHLRGDWPTPEQEAVVELWLRAADGVLVTTQALADRVVGHNARVLVVPNQLDERLLVRRRPESCQTPFGRRPVVIGYMGTATHAADLEMVAAALAEVAGRTPGVRLELVGVAGRQERERALGSLPVRMLDPKAPEQEYAPFMVWFTATARWDIAISPLSDTPFSLCKSDVKFLDYAALGAAPVMSRHPAYRTVRHGETGLLCQSSDGDWASALERLVGDEAERVRLAEGAARYLWCERVLARRAGELPAAVAALLAR